MTIEPATPPPTTPREPLGASTELAQLRTIMAADRTLMAWTRTALALLSFSFTIYKVLQGIQERGKPVHPHAPEAAGLFLAGMGVFAQALGSVQFALTVRQLQKLQTFSAAFRAPAVMAGLMFIIGVVLFLGIAIHRL